jgi:hypothetical protein
LLHWSRSAPTRRERASSEVETAAIFKFDAPPPTSPSDALTDAFAAGSTQGVSSRFVTDRIG